MVTADSYFTIGTTHEVCEDFACATTIKRDDLDHRPNLTLAVVADGCSGSPQTDWGARFLCQSAVAILGNLNYTVGPEGGVVLESLQDRGLQIYERADAMRRTCEISPLSNDATLMVAYWHWGTDNIVVTVWGDGVIAARNRHTGVLEYHVIAFAMNAPGYLAYSANLQRKGLFYANTNEGEHTIHTYVQGKETALMNWERRRGLDPIVFQFPVADYDLVSVISDGAEAFQDKDQALIPLDQVISHIMNVKGFKGNFAVRRVRNGFLRRFATKQGWSHYDDLAVGMVHVPEEAVPTASMEGGE